MRIQKDIIGKEILNKKGNVIGTVKDIEIDNYSKKITFLVLNEAKKSGFSFTRNNTDKEEKIPIEEVGSIGDKIILKESISEKFSGIYEE